MLRFRSLYTYHTSKSVQDALLKKRPVVALESTIITHGMPYPANLQTAREIESIVKSYGCTPATIAILNGEIKVGLSDAELVTLATSQNVVKTSRRDLAWVVSQKLNGSTTVSATMIAADKVGIPIFVTGGIGGVHRDFENAFDVSADLTELGRTSVAVVCAGVKSILDIEKTLEYLETMGVTVVSYGDSDNFPAFFTNANKELGIGSGMIIAVPISEKDSFGDPLNLEKCIQDALKECGKLAIKGKQVTPFVLQKVKELTKGGSLKANISLIKQNAHIGSQIALSLSKKRQGHRLFTPSKSRPVIIGGIVLDIIGKVDTLASRNSIGDNSTIGTIKESLGGVARNIAEACFRSGGDPIFKSIVGKDFAGQIVLQSMKDIGMDTSHLEICDTIPTAKYNAFLGIDGERVSAVADMRIFERLDVTEFLNEHEPLVMAMDANIPQNAMDQITQYAFANNCNLIYDPTSISKSSKILRTPKPNAVKYIFPNAVEAADLAEQIYKAPFEKRRPPIISNTDETIQILVKLLCVFDNVILKQGSLGVVYGSVRSEMEDVECGSEMCIKANGLVWRISHIKPMKVNNPVSVTGCGDTMAGTFVAGLARSTNLYGHGQIQKLLELCCRNAELTLQSELSVSPNIKPLKS